MNDISRQIQAELAALAQSPSARQSDARLAATEDRINDPEIQKKIKDKLCSLRKTNEFKQKHLSSVRQSRAISCELIRKIFQEFHDPDRIIDNRTFKTVLSKTYNISIGHINKICMARARYVQECLGLSPLEIHDIKHKYHELKPIYVVQSFGTDMMSFYENYSYRSKFPISFVWQYRFGMYKGLKKQELEKQLGIKFTSVDMESLKKSYPWLTDRPSIVVYKGDREGAVKYGPAPTKKQKISFIKTGKYVGHLVRLLKPMEALK